MELELPFFAPNKWRSEMHTSIHRATPCIFSTRPTQNGRNASLLICFEVFAPKNGLKPSMLRADLFWSKLRCSVLKRIPNKGAKLPQKRVAPSDNRQSFSNYFEKNFFR